jgi:succinate dehydrogenase/fumarate reductase-like Fe-S protein
VRIVRDDGQRRRALDVPDACRDRGKGDALEIAPLSNLPVIKDLVTDMREFFDKWAGAKGRFKGKTTRHDDFARFRRSRPSARPRTPASSASAAASATHRATS